MSNQLTVQGFTQELMPALKSNGIEAILPKHVSLETFTRLAAIAVISNPMLVNADQQSVIQSLILSAKDGLVCDGREAALVPFNTKVQGQWVNKAQYMPMVDGVLKRVRQSGQVKLIASKPVFDNDEFQFWTDEDGDHFKHVPYMGKDSGELIAVIAYAIMNDGSKHVELLRRWEIDRVREASKSGNKEGSPWSKWYDRMACKTGLHRVARRLPNSSEILEMLERGEQMEWQQERDITPQKEAESIDDFLEQADPVEALEASRDLFAGLLADLQGASSLEELSVAIQASANAGEQLNDEQKVELSKASKAAKQRIQQKDVEF